MGSLLGLSVRAAPFALLLNSRKTECGAMGSLPSLAVRAAPFALLGGAAGFEVGEERGMICYPEGV